MLKRLKSLFISKIDNYTNNDKNYAQIQINDISLSNSNIDINQLQINKNIIENSEITNDNDDQSQKKKRSTLNFNQKKPDDKNNKKFEWSLYKKILKYTKKEWKLCLIIQINLACLAICQTSKPYYYGKFLDIATKQQENEELQQLVIQFWVIIALLVIFQSIEGYYSNIIGEKIINQMRSDLYKHFINCDMEFFEKHKTGELMSRLGSDISSAKQAASGNITWLFKHILHCIGNIVMLFTLSWKLTTIVLIIIPVYYYVTSTYSKYSKRAIRRQQDVHADTSEIAEEIFSGIVTVKSFCNEDLELQRYNNKQNENFNIQQQKSLMSSAYSAMTTFLDNAPKLMILWYGCHLVLSSEDNITTGTLGSFILYSQSLSNNAQSISHSISQIISSMGAMERIFEMLNYQPKIKNDQGIIIQNIKGQIDFENVYFAYPQTNVSVINNINFSISSGDYIAIVGASGCGKSTLIKLLERFYDVTEGQIKLDGINIKDINLKCLRNIYGLVCQEPILFSGTIEENITYGVENYTNEELDRVSQMSGAHEFINDKIRFPNGYNTLVGEKGLKLSVGQKQRVAIARALIKQPKFLIFDEATSALDSESEFQVQQSIDKLVMQNTNMTIIVIAHRLSTIVNCKKIIVLQKGSIVEFGSHRELIEKDGIYKQLVEKQLQNSEEKQEINTLVTN